MMPMLTRDEVHVRLQEIFPDGAPNRAYLTRMLAASTVFVALYIDATEGSGTMLGPKHVYRMTDEQAALVDDASRTAYATGVLRTGSQTEGRRWYQDNTREPIRDETLREGLVAIGAVIERTDLPTTSSKPRYALKASFAALFDPALTGEALQARTAAWQAEALNKGALARLAIVRQGAGVSADQVLVTFPNGETRRMKPGPSSEITKAVVEVFAPAFLTAPAVVFLSESGNKVVARDDALARSIGLAIQADKNLPDTILVDLGPVHPLLVFVEVVATDGPISQRRKEALEELVAEAGFPAEHVAFVTAYLDRSAGPFKKTVDSLAWGSYAWFAAEPERLMVFSEARESLRGRP
ncbi:MAG: restriction endonuclease [Salinicola sp.]|uniref:Restriction endonuclease n=1 Tax=Sphingobium soli TaxID=1591116 RepID=A0ABS8H899_9SPHN|nr:BsuBI/PstI family type II restriction endonuclease [Sphingobium soli]MAM58778.1 restriction endonuclease [Salinicola sp.]MCC4234649.1 restriction endonuclease [Sphingobium soli]|tara:strand:+ start:4254 stop:5315 length:1062 start_codon:yes stop_codon:yes gene_type:complete